MNLLTEINRLPAHSKIALAAMLLRDIRPSLSTLAKAACTTETTVRGWLQMRKR